MTLPVTEYRPLNRRQRQELRGYVALSTSVFRALLFLVGVAIVGFLSRAAQTAIAHGVPAVESGPWWLVPPLALA